MTSEFTSHSGSGGDFVTGLAESTFGQMNASRLLNPETFRSQDFLQPAIDAIPLFSVFEEERWQTTAGCLFVDSAGVNLQGMHHSSSITPPLWLSVPPSLARVHPFVPRMAKIQLWLDSLPFELRSEVLDVVVLPASWERRRPVAVFTQPRPSSSYLVAPSNDKVTPSISSTVAATRSALARIIRVLYFALTMSCYHRIREAIWLDLLTTDASSRMYLRARSSATAFSSAASLSPSSPLADVSVRETSLRAAMINISEAADHLVHHRLFWLWPFTEQIVWFAQRIGLGAFGCGLEMWFRGLGYAASWPYMSRGGVDQSCTTPSSSEEASLQAVVRTASQITPDGPHQSILCIIHAVLYRAHTAFTYAPSAALHLPSVRLLSTVAAAASVRAPELSGEGPDGTQVPDDSTRPEKQRHDGVLGPSVSVGGSRREVAGGAAMSRALAGRRR